MSLAEIDSDLSSLWDDSILPQLLEFVRIPNRSPLFDPDWDSRGHMERAVQLAAQWCQSLGVAGSRIFIQRLTGRTPLLVIDVPGELAGEVLFYGHLDKQPEYEGWEPGLNPWVPVVRDGKLYGRGAADDGYAVFASFAVIAALRRRDVRLPRCVLLIECSEESDSEDLPAHLDTLGDWLDPPDLVVCLDSAVGNYEQLWSTTSLRGNVNGTLRIRVLKAGVHSGAGTGIAPVPFRIAMQLLSRLEDTDSGELRLEALTTPIPADRLEQIRAVADTLGDSIAGELPFLPGTQPVADSPSDLIARSTWAATLAVIGAEGLPPLATAGNVLLPDIALKLSFRLPPTIEGPQAAQAIRAELERDPPCAAHVSFEITAADSGWNAPPLAAWLEDSLARASHQVFGRPALYLGCGGSIPFMSMLGKRYPSAQFLITGVLGPQSNAHGPNEFLHLPYAKRLTCCVARVLQDCARTLDG